MKRWMLALIICIPLASVVFGGVMAYFAFSGDDESVHGQDAPLSKTSWRETESQAQP